MTMTEKILAKHSDNNSVAPGQNIWTRVDKLMTHDVCGPGTFGIFQKEFGENAQVGRAGASPLGRSGCASSSSTRNSSSSSS
jgi:homoaconitase/3-isopropylmalate dehydratase large subunit